MRKSPGWRIGVCTLAGIAALSVWQLAPTRAQAPDAKKQSQKRPPDPEENYNGPMNKVLLKDFDPTSNLVVVEHHPLKAKFPAIDVHVHPSARTPEQIARWVKSMDDTGVDVMVLMTGAVGADFDKLVDLYLKPYPTRFILFCGMDTRNLDVDAPDYPRKVTAELERCYRKGARGVGEITDKGRGYNQSSYADTTPPPESKRLHVDDHRLDMFFEKCGELHMPINQHIADMPASWQPPDAHNELGATYAAYNQYGADIPSHDELVNRFLAMIARHPKTTFIACHFANIGNDLGWLGRALDEHPNLVVDSSARDFEMGRQPFSMPAFLAKYKTRVLFGSDNTPGDRMWRFWWRLFETRDEFMKGTAWWRIYGLGLPDDVLKAYLHDNARRVLNWTRPQL